MYFKSLVCKHKLKITKIAISVELAVLQAQKPHCCAAPFASYAKCLNITKAEDKQAAVTLASPKQLIQLIVFSYSLAFSLTLSFAELNRIYRSFIRDSYCILLDFIQNGK